MAGLKRLATSLCRLYSYLFPVVPSLSLRLFHSIKGRRNLPPSVVYPLLYIHFLPSQSLLSYSVTQSLLPLPFSLIFSCILVIVYLFDLPLHTNAFVFSKTPRQHDLFLCFILVIISLPVLTKTMSLTSDRLLKILTIFHSGMRSPGNRKCMDTLNPYYNITHHSEPKCSY